MYSFLVPKAGAIMTKEEFDSLNIDDSVEFYKAQEIDIDTFLPIGPHKVVDTKRFNGDSYIAIMINGYIDYYDFTNFLVRSKGSNETSSRHKELRAKYPHNCPECGGYAYVGLQIECMAKCKYETR